MKNLFESGMKLFSPDRKLLNQLKSRYDVLATLAETLAQTNIVRQEISIAKNINDLSRRAHVFASNIATAQVQNNDLQGAKLSFEMAMISARLIDSMVEREESLEKIIDFQIVAELFEDSISTTKHLEYSQSDALQRIAIAQAQAGLFDEAILTTRKIIEARDRIRAYTTIAEKQANNGDPINAKNTFSIAISNANQIKDDLDRIPLLSEIATCQAVAKMPEEALITAALIDDDMFDYARVLASIAEQQAYCGDMNQAQELFKRAIIIARGERDLNNFLPYTLSYIVKKTVLAGLVKEALETSALISDPIALSDALLSIAKKQIELDQLSEASQCLKMAFETAKDISVHSYRPEVLVKIVNHTAKAKLFPEAINFAKQIEEEGSKSIAYASIANSQASSNLFDEARNTLLYVKISHMTIPILATIAKGQASCGLFKDAFASMGQIKNNGQLGDDILIVVAEKMAEADDYNAAIRTAQTISSLYSRAEVLANIAYIQMVAGSISGAQSCFELATSTATQINSDYNRFVTLTQIENRKNEALNNSTLNPK